MKKIFTNNDIERFFEAAKSLDPVIDNKKVHQIINSPKAVARLKGKNNNLLKITIMTTIIAVIISAVLLWPGEDSNSQVSGSRLEVSGSRLEVSDSKFQVPDSGTEVPGSGFQVEHIEQASESIENNLTVDESSANGNKDEMVAKSDFHRDLVEPSNNNQMVDDVVKDEPSDTVAESSDKEMLTDIETFETVDGSKFILRLNKEELEKIGFFVSDSLIRYRKCVNGRQIVYYYEFIAKNTSGKSARAKSPLQVASVSSPCQGTTTMYPSCQTNTFFSNLRIVDYFEEEDFNLVNDTLIPIIIPLSTIDPEVMDDILWFALSPDLLSILSEKHKPIIDEFMKYKQAKKVFPKTDLIRYQAPKLIDDSKILELSLEELNKIGFQFYADSTVYKVRTEEIIKTKSGARGFSDVIDVGMLPDDDGCFAVSVTRQDGSPYWDFGRRVQSLFPNNTKYGSEFSLLIPVLIKSKNTFFEEDVIFWFYPTNYLFEQLPERISIDLRKEYNYIITEDKSALVKPECKYFDECKNTLEITDFKAFPNPATYEVSVSFELPETIEARISLVDLTGREKQVLHPQSQFAAGRHQLNFDLSSVPEGMYLITLYSDKGVQTQRLMVVR